MQRVLFLLWVALRLHHFVAIGRELGLAHNVLRPLTEEWLLLKTVWEDIAAVSAQSYCGKVALGAPPESVVS
jgi:hypothetical protein